MSEEELEKIRSRYLSQAQGESQGQQNVEEAQREAQREAQMESAKQNILRTILSEGARRRLGNLRLVKIERAQSIEAQLIQLHQTGQLRSQVSEEQFLKILRQFDVRKREGKIQFKRG